MRFLIDTQLPPALARWLKDEGHPSQHVLDVQLAQASDSAVWHYATKQDLVIVTKDEDFAEWARMGRRGPAVVWLRIGNSSTPFLLTWMKPLLPEVLRRLEQNERLVEVR